MRPVVTVTSCNRNNTFCVLTVLLVGLIAPQIGSPARRSAFRAHQSGPWWLPESLARGIRPPRLAYCLFSCHMSLRPVITGEIKSYSPTFPTTTGLREKETALNKPPKSQSPMAFETWEAQKGTTTGISVVRYPYLPTGAKHCPARWPDNSVRVRSCCFGYQPALSDLPCTLKQITS